MRRLALGALALAVAVTAARADEGRTLAVAVDRSATLGYADPGGEGRAAVALALALVAKPVDRLAVFVAGHETAIATTGKDLEGLTGALRTIADAPVAAGGVELGAALAGAAERAGPHGALVLYACDELDVIDARGKAPAAALERARAKDPRPDRKAVNEAARALLVEQFKKPGGAFVAVRAQLPEEARTVPFVESLGAEAVDLEAGRTLELVRKLVLALGGLDPGEPRPPLGIETGKVSIAADPGTRVALAADGPVSVAGGLQIDKAGRFWVVDAAGPVEVSGQRGVRVAALAAVRPRIEVAAEAWRLASGKVFVKVVPKDPKVQLVARAGESELPRTGDAFFARVDVPADASEVVVRTGPDASSLAESRVEVKRATVTIAVDEATPPIAGAATNFVARAPGLPVELVPPALGVVLKGPGDARVELARKGAEHAGEGVLPAAGDWTVAALEPAELAFEPLAFATAPAPRLTVTRAGEGRLVLASDGTGTVALEIALDPASKGTLAARVEGLRAPATASASIAPRELGSKTARVALATTHVDGVTPVELVVRAELPRRQGLEARVTLELEPAFGWKKLAALGLLGVALAWVGVVVLRRRQLDRRFGKKQLRGIGSNGRLSYERYLLRDHLVSRSAAVLPPGATAVRVELDGENRANAKALEGTFLMSAAKGLGRVKSIALVHETPFLVVRELYTKRLVYLEDEPTAEELLKRYVPDAPSYDGGESRDSDVFVLLDDKENMVPPSARLVPVESERLPKVDEVIQAESDEAVIVTDSDEEKVIDDPDASVEDLPKLKKEQATDIDVLDPGSDDSTVGESSDDTTESSELDAASEDSKG